MARSASRSASPPAGYRISPELTTTVVNLLAKSDTGSASAGGGTRTGTTDLATRLADTPSHVLRKLRRKLQNGLADILEEKQRKKDARCRGSLSVEVRGLPWTPASTPHGVQHRLLGTVVTPRHAQEYASRLFHTHAQKLSRQESLRKGENASLDE